MHAAQRVGQAVACGACSHVIGVQGTAGAAAGSDGEVLLAVLDSPLLVGAGNQMLEADGLVELPVMEHCTSSIFMMATLP